MVTTAGSLEAAAADEALITQVSEWIAQQVAGSGAKYVVLGLSGGIDSAVVAGLSARAIGGGRVLGVIMPSGSNPDDAEQARLVAEAFGIHTTTVDLSAVTSSMLDTLPAEAALADLGVLDSDDPAVRDRRQLAHANVKPRLRMISLYYVANLTQGIVVGTGNKSEALIGYFTKHGDGGADMFPIIDLYKHEVRRMARVLGVPDSVISRPPSAGLWAGQTDEDELGMSYEQLDEALQAIESGAESTIDSDVLRKVKALRAASEHKRLPVAAFRRS